MNVAVVGGGYSGCLAALLLAEQGHRVDLYEAGDALGGILRDAVLPQGRFFPGCQYINIDPVLMALVDTVEGTTLQRFDHRYGSWNDLFGAVRVHHDFAQPVVPGPLGALQPVAEGEQDTLGGRLAAYEARVAGPLTAWAARHGAPDALAAQNAAALQVGRVFYADDAAAMQQAKQQDDRADRLYGLPRSHFDPPRPLQQAALPLDGFDAFIQALQTALQRRGVQIHLQAPVKPLPGADGRIQLQLRQQPIAADAVVWCANPTALLQRLGGERLQSPALRCVNLFARLEGRAPEAPVYYQAFGATHPLLRLFCYGGERPRITVEALDEAWPLADLVAAAEQVLHDLGWDLRLADASLQPQLRYSLLTTHDLHCIERFGRQAARQGIITGGWQHYGRDPRLHHIFAEMAAAGLA
ncbi:NAD(P)-binding protein [Aquincola tertiaricarbonis]|uniref:NAD(P)-binding protein n=1 Tax=Aquincola tertiaricarbonis TaxID=391953 RepID=A0ABY4S1R4_AQUTE|nr:NAD(P)-binding protein [Aquincola tertiaricarbonis]URI06324.1 NAD(P)-binding protein [Aquincola tertiaricarbonis]